MSTIEINIYDNGGETADRYTVTITDPAGELDVYTMSEDANSAQGINQYSHTTEVYHGTPLKVSEVPEQVLQAAIKRI